MKNFFTIGETAKLHNISKQSLIFYHKKNILIPSYVDNDTGYRYYSIKDMFILDNILLLKNMYVPLSDIKKYLEKRDISLSYNIFNDQKKIIDKKIKNLIEINKKIDDKLSFINSYDYNQDKSPSIEYLKKIHTISFNVDYPYSLKAVDILNKKLAYYMHNKKISFNYNFGVTIDINDLTDKNFLKHKTSFCILRTKIKDEKYKEIMSNLYGVIYHKGSYNKIDTSYNNLISYIEKENHKICGDSVEFCIVDPGLEKNEENYITKIMIPIEKV
ncbi:MAG: MerR family transcriptional regulator [Oscillospiraceae bacterium]